MPYYRRQQAKQITPPKNGIAQRSIVAPLFFDIYTYDLPSRFAYADDLALLHSSGNWKDLNGTLSQDMSTLLTYLQTWKLKLSHTKLSHTKTFHLNNREVKCELKVYNNSRLLPFCPTPTYLGVKLERSLTFRHHLVALRKKLCSRVTLLRRLVGSGWGAGAKTLRIVFYLNNWKAKCELKIYNSNALLSFCPTFFILWLNWTDRSHSVNYLRASYC